MNRRMIRAKAARKWHAAQVRQVRRIVAGAMACMADSIAESIQAHATLGDTMRDAARAVQGFMVATLVQRAARQVLAGLPRFHAGGFVGGMARPGEVHAVILPPGQLFARERGSSEPPQLLGTTGPISVQVHPHPGDVPQEWMDRMPPGGRADFTWPIGCTCTVERVVKTDSRGQFVHVDVPGPTCAWCTDLEARAADQGFGLVAPQCCGVCGDVIDPDVMMGTTCACARRPPAPRATSTWSATRCTCEPNPDGDRCEYCDAWLAGQA